MPDQFFVTQKQVARSAVIVSLGNVLSRVVGLARGIVNSNLFGAHGPILAFTAAEIVPRRFYELLVGGMITSALVPTLSEFAAQDDHDELWRLGSLLLTLAMVGLGSIVLVLQWIAPWITRILVGGFDAALQAETTRLLRIVLWGILFLGLSGLTTSLCQALQRFTLPALTTAMFNVVMVVTALMLGPRWGVSGLAVGLVAGAALQLILQLPALRDMRFRPSLQLDHPALRRILYLYLPIVLGMIPNELGIVLDRNLASRVGNSMAIMDYATLLRQFPLGLVSMAVSTAILPALARQSALERGAGSTAFRETLSGGLRMVLLLTMPAVALLGVLAGPVVALIFEHGEFGPADTLQVALALRHYLLGLVFAAVDQPLVFAFYARQDTMTPAAVGVIGVVLYTLVAVPTVGSLGMVGLILANNVQLAGHTLIMLVLFWRRVGSLGQFGLGKMLLQTLVASGVMGGIVYALAGWLTRWLPLVGRPGWAVVVGVSGCVGGSIYLALCAWMRVPELTWLWRWFWQLAARVRSWSN